jgi:CRP-like cAMP-binding protein
MHRRPVSAKSVSSKSVSSKPGSGKSGSGKSGSGGSGTDKSAAGAPVPAGAVSAIPVAPSSLAASGLTFAGAKSRVFEFARGARLTGAGAPLAEAYLVTEGLVAILARTPGGGAAEAGLAGPGGLVGHAAALGAARCSSEAVALTEVRGLALDASALADLAEQRPALRRELAAYALARMAEAERICACAALHSVEQRLARWLLSAAALLGDRPIAITHQQFSDLFGVRRASVTTSLHLLEGDRAVRCRRGRVEIRDLARLEAASCGCHVA